MNRIARQCILLTRVPYSIQPGRYISTSRIVRNLVNNKTCWQCQSNNRPSALFCENKVCKVIQPIPPQLNFFHLLQVGGGHNKDEPVFNIDLKAMRRQFLSLQQKAHPDSFSRAPKREHEYAQLQSSVINKAYHTLKNPLTRAQYILKQQGIQVNESDSTDNTALLMEIMEAREELDDISTEDEWKELKRKNEVKYDDTVNRLNDAFSHKDYTTAKSLAIELQYWNSLKTAIDEWHNE
ncbi:hypothetical protein BDB01DRAFT_797441 [Pilobolus umbonatus]|nr:hypothetical protein BDB01DRAFT_797441 [Pilobolus umbonatus]